MTRDISISPGIYIGGNLVYLYGHKWLDQERIAIDKNEGVSGPIEDGIAERLYLSPGNAADDAVSSADIDRCRESDIRNLRRTVSAGQVFDRRRLMRFDGVNKDDPGFDRSSQHFLRGLVLTGYDLAFAGDGLGAVRRGEQVLAIFEDDEEP